MSALAYQRDARYFYTARESNPALVPLLSADGSIVRRSFSYTELQAGELAGENQRRIDALEGGARSSASYRCYQVKAGWVVEMRKEKGAENSPWNLFREARFTGFLESEPGCTMLLRQDDPRPTLEWNGFVRALESTHNISVGAQTVGDPHGHYAAEVSTNISPGSDSSLTGFGTEAALISGVTLTKVGRTIVTRPPGAPRHREGGLHYVHSRGMAIAQFDGKNWSKLFMLPSGELTIRGADCTGIQYAQGCFEGMVAVYNGNDRVSIFRCGENARRINESAAAAGIPPIPEEQFKAAVLETVRVNLPCVPLNNGKLYLRPYLIGMEGGAGAKRADKYLFAVEAFPFGNYAAGRDASISVVGLLDTHRPTTGSHKLGMNYGRDFALKAEVVKAGYADFISFTPKGLVEELSSCAVFFIFRDREGILKFCTPPARGDKNEGSGGARSNILPSITRRSVIELLTLMGFETQVRDIHFAELLGFVGAFNTGTAMGITRIGNIDLLEGIKSPNTLISKSYQDSDASRVIGEIYDLVTLARQGRLSGPYQHLNSQWATSIPAEPNILLR